MGKKKKRGRQPLHRGKIKGKKMAEKEKEKKSFMLLMLAVTNGHFSPNFCSPFFLNFGRNYRVLWWTMSFVHHSTKRLPLI